MLTNFTNFSANGQFQRSTNQPRKGLQMATKRKNYSPEFKAKVALEAAKELQTVSRLSSEYGVHPNQIGQWKKQLCSGAKEIFSRQAVSSEGATAEETARLYEQIGRLQVELGWMKKKCPSFLKRDLIDPQDADLSVVRQCELLGLARSSYYYRPGEESEENLALMRLIDRQYMETPFYGSRRITDWLCREGWEVNRKRIQRLMRLMGLEALYPKPQTSQKNEEHRIYPDLLRGVLIDRPNQVGSSDITDVPLARGFLYLVAIIDWHSRYVLAWELSNTLDTAFCLEALDKALRRAKPEIFNSDQGCQFTSAAFTGRLEAEGIRISMDGTGRALDNIFVERLWRSVKYEDLYLKDYPEGWQLWKGMAAYFPFYNERRPHQSLGRRTPAEVYFGEWLLETTSRFSGKRTPSPGLRRVAFEKAPQNFLMGLRR